MWFDMPLAFLIPHGHQMLNSLCQGTYELGFRTFRKANVNNREIVYLNLCAWYVFINSVFYKHINTLHS